MWWDLLIFAIASVAGAVASIAGFGIGSLLTPLLAIDLGTRLAVAAIAIPHVVGTALRFWLLGTAPSARVLWTFGMASAAGGMLGAWLHTWAANPWLTLVFGALLVFTGVSELMGLAQRMRFGGVVAWLAGAVSGFLGGLVGNQGGVRSGALLGFERQPRTFVATATAIGLIVDAARLPFYLWRESGALVQHARWIGVATIGVVLGTILGGRLLVRIPERRFRRMVAVVVGLLGAYMLFRAAGDLGWGG